MHRTAQAAGTQPAAATQATDSAWPFAPLTEQQLAQRNAMERALRAGMPAAVAQFCAAFDDTVTGALA